MLHRILKLITLVVCGVALTGPAFCADTLFTIFSSDKSKSFVVTQDVINQVGMKSYKAILPSSDGETHQVKGPLLRDLLKAANLNGTAVLARALDDYEMPVPSEDYTKYDVMLATEVDGKPLSVRDHGPAWVVYPSVDHPELNSDVYQSRSVWQVKELVVQ